MLQEVAEVVGMEVREHREAAVVVIDEKEGLDLKEVGKVVVVRAETAETREKVLLRKNLG